jgi:hypothetical protein
VCVCLRTTIQPTSHTRFKHLTHVVDAKPRRRWLTDVGLCYNSGSVVLFKFPFGIDIKNLILYILAFSNCYYNLYFFNYFRVCVAPFDPRQLYDVGLFACKRIHIRIYLDIIVRKM